MGKGGRICCIAAPWLLTLASFICLILIQISGWNKSMLPGYYFFRADFTDLDLSQASDLANTTTLTEALRLSERDGTLADIYEIHLWNYCSSDDGTKDGVDFCSPRQANYYFNPISAWKLNRGSVTSSQTSSADNPAESVANQYASQLEDHTKELENNLLGDSAHKAMDAYRTTSKVVFTLYAIAFWTTLATLGLSIFAIFSRWGSFLTWIFSLGSTIITTAAVATSTGLFLALTGALKTVFDPYNVNMDIGTRALSVEWLGVVFSWAATLFWLVSICCCSGASNPHHRGKKGGLWNAEAKGQGYGDYGRGRGLRVEKTGGTYERVASPYLGHAENERGDRVPLTDYPQQPGYAPTGGAAYEPYRHGQ